MKRVYFKEAMLSLTIAELSRSLPPRLSASAGTAPDQVIRVETALVKAAIS